MPDHELQDTWEGKLLLWLADWLTVLLLSVGTLFPCLEAYGVSERRDFDFGAVMAFCVFASLASAVIFTWRHGYWAALGILAVEGLIFRRLWVHTVEDWRLIREPDLSDLFNATPGALFLLYALAILLLGWTVVRGRVWWLASAITLFPVLPAIQGGQLPAWWAMLVGFAGWGAMLLTDLFDRRDKESLGRARLLSLGGITALVIALVICLPMEGYTRPQWATDARRELILGTKRHLSRFLDQETLENNLLARLGLDLSVEDETSALGPGYGWGGTGTGETATTGMGPREDLSIVGPRRYTDRVLMVVNTDQPNPAGRMYLKGASFGNYTGLSWESGGGPEDFYPEKFPLLTALELPVYTMRIRDTRFWGTWYYPYRYNGADRLDGDGRLTMEWGGDLENDFQGQAGSRNGMPSADYSVLYRPGGPENGFTPLDGAAAEAEAIYRTGFNGFGTYLALPHALQSALAPLAEEIGRIPVTVDERLPEQYQGAVAAAARTASWLASTAEYDLNASVMEDGEDDFVQHFLEEKRGFCVHFATAGAMLLRAQGIPTRYVNGYVLTLDSRGQGTVRDSDAHAWVEIYLDGYGWYPVEMTPGYTGGPTGAGLEGAVGESEADEPDAEAPEELPPDAEELPEEFIPEDSATPEDSAAPEEEAPAPEETEEEEPGVAFPWKLLFGLAVFWAILCAAYLAALLVRNRAKQDKDTNRSVLNAYGRYKRLRRWGCGEDDELTRLAKKAKFSQHTLTEEERESAWKSLNEDVKQSRIGQPKRRRWLLALLEPVF